MEATLGNRFCFRFLGLLTPARWTPVRVTVGVTGVPAGSQVEVTVLSNEGRYLVRVDALADRVYARQFSWLLAKLRAAAPPVS